MTERKPLGMNFTSWIDEQIVQAQERGAFDDLPGAGQPLPNRGDEDAAQAWIREYVRKEGIPAEELLPAPLKLRKERSRLVDAAPEFRSEASLREAVADLNSRIMQWRRIPVGPPIFVPLADAEDLVSRWRAARPAAAAPASAPGAGEPAAAPEAGRSAGRRWWRRAAR
jgi:hypothetical protein